MIKTFLKAALPSSIKDLIIQRRMPRIPALENPAPGIVRTRIPIAVLTRAFNRLEYTVRCVDSVARQVTDIDFVHVVVDQNSDDGTEQWFNWLWRNPKPFWARLGYIRLRKNLGDWGGMIFSHVAISEKYKHIMQLDNDSELVSTHTLTNLSYALDILGLQNIIMCRRIGSGDAYGRTGGDIPLLPLSRTYKLKLHSGVSKVYVVNHAVTCYMADRILLAEAIELGCTAACRFCKTLHPKCQVYKLHDVPATTLQGWDGERYLQHEKYYRGSVSTGMNYLRVGAEEIIKKPEQFIDYSLPPACDTGWLKI